MTEHGFSGESALTSFYSYVILDIPNLGGFIQMKKVLSLLLIMILLIGVITIPAQAASDGAKIKLDGEIVSLVAYNIRDNNYFKLRDIANILKGTEAHFDVLWNAEVGAIEIVSNTDYSTVEEITSEKFENPRIIKSSAKIYKDDNLVLLNAYNINDNTFFKLRDLADVIDFGVEWNAEEEIIEVNSAASYVHPGASGEGLAINTGILSLLNKNKAYVDARYEYETTGYNENDHVYNRYQLTVTYETPVTPESSVIGLEVSLDNLFYSCPEYVAPEAIMALFDEYKTGYSEDGYGAYLTVNYCGYELTFWRSADEEYFSNTSCVGLIYLDTPYVSDELSGSNGVSETNFIGSYDADWMITGSYVNIEKAGADYYIDIFLVRSISIENAVGRLIGKNLMSFEGWDSAGYSIDGTIEWSEDYSAITIKTDSEFWKYAVSESGKITCYKK